MYSFFFQNSYYETDNTLIFFKTRVLLSATSTFMNCEMLNYAFLEKLVLRATDNLDSSKEK